MVDFNKFRTKKVVNNGVEIEEDNPTVDDNSVNVDDDNTTVDEGEQIQYLMAFPDGRMVMVNDLIIKEDNTVLFSPNLSLIMGCLGSLFDNFNLADLYKSILPTNIDKEDGAKVE